MLRQLDDGLWRHASRDDWSKNLAGSYSCGCVHEGVSCSPESVCPAVSPWRFWGEQETTWNGTVIGYTEGHTVTFAGGGSFTFGPGVVLAGPNDLAPEG